MSRWSLGKSKHRQGTDLTKSPRENSGFAENSVIAENSGIAENSAIAENSGIAWYWS